MDGLAFESTEDGAVEGVTTITAFFRFNGSTLLVTSSSSMTSSSVAKAWLTYPDSSSCIPTVDDELEVEELEDGLLATSGCSLNDILLALTAADDGLGLLLLLLAMLPLSSSAVTA